jgi:hypothetical protein
MGRGVLDDPLDLLRGCSPTVQERRGRLAAAFEP